jgi:hypothetical protein
MSFPVFKDFDKDTSDLINEDFDSKYSLKIKSAGPEGTSITTNTAYDAKNTSLAPKLSMKWAHDNGFSLDKLEFSKDCKITVETSLTKVVPGLKLEFKGNDENKADLLMTYKMPQATFTGEYDIHKFSSAKASICSGSGAISAGASIDAKFGGKDDSIKPSIGLGYTAPDLFVGLRVNSLLKNPSYSGLASYGGIRKDVVMAGSASMEDGKTIATLATQYICNPATCIKVKASTDGALAASVKQDFAKKFSVVGSAEVTGGDFSAAKFGINATLG